MQIFLISLPSAIERRKFQQEQLSKLDLRYSFVDAISVENISNITYKQHYHDWQRPMLKTEVACYYSHRFAWDKVLKSGEPAIILEDDALLSKYVPKLLDNLIDVNDIDLINLENRGRKKFVSNLYLDIVCNSKLIRLYQDRTGAAGYLLWPSGANKLIQFEKNNGIGLADAHITSCNNLISYQIEPSPIIQIDQCEYYGIENNFPENISISTVSRGDTPKGGIKFIVKRLIYQFRLGLRQLLLITKSKRRYIEIRKTDFL